MFLHQAPKLRLLRWQALVRIRAQFIKAEKAVPNRKTENHC
jgi:hypothetical protein